MRLARAPSVTLLGNLEIIIVKEHVVSWVSQGERIIKVGNPLAGSLLQIKVGPSGTEPRSARKGEAAVVSQSIHSDAIVQVQLSMPAASTKGTGSSSQKHGSDRKKSPFSDVRSCLKVHGKRHGQAAIASNGNRMKSPYPVPTVLEILGIITETCH